ncbi:hypothetical protein MD484_g7156, partial [Candolleomyces efflorescens]
MRRYLWSRFNDIGLRINNLQWFSEDDVETLVKAGSGQFIYVATVYKFISERRTTPRARLDTVLTWTPQKWQYARPFEALDRLYTSILLAAKETYENVDTHQGHDFLLLFRVYHVNIKGYHFDDVFPTLHTADTLSALLCLEPQAEETLVADLRSLASLETDEGNNLRLRLYHKSFSDFLEEPSRANDLFVPEYRVYTHLSRCLMQYIINCPLDFDSLPAKWERLALSEWSRNCLKCAISDMPRFLASPNTAIADHDGGVVSFTANGGWQKVDKLFPLLMVGPSMTRFCRRGWFPSIHEVSDKLRDRMPDTATRIKSFVTKWEDDLRTIEGTQ